MENKIEEQETQNAPVVEEPKTTEEVAEEVIISEEAKEEEPKLDIEDLQKKADVSSQNFERAKKAEARVKELELQDNYVLSEDDTELKNTVAEMQTKLEASEVKEVYPQLKDSWDDFESFRQEDDNKGMPTKTAAKAFLAEKGLLEPKRKGLEKAKGGKGIPPTSGMTNEQLKDIRTNDPKKYREMVRKGQITFAKS